MESPRCLNPMVSLVFSALFLAYICKLILYYFKVVNNRKKKTNTKMLSGIKFCPTSSCITRWVSLLLHSPESICSSKIVFDTLNVHLHQFCLVPQNNCEEKHRRQIYNTQNYQQSRRDYIFFFFIWVNEK